MGAVYGYARVSTKDQNLDRQMDALERRGTKTIGADVEVLDMPLLNTRDGVDGLTGAFPADIVLQVMCYLAQMERERTRARQREGIEAAKLRGVKFGPAFIEVPGNFQEVHESYRRKERTRRECARELGVSPSTFNRWRKSRGSALSA